MSQPPNADETQPTSFRRTPESPDEPEAPKKRGTTWRGPGGIRVSLIGLIGVALVLAGILILVQTGNAAFGSRVVVVGFGVLLIDALRAR